MTPEVLEERLALLNALDLEPIKFKLTHPTDGIGWTLAEADAAELEYKQFLTLNLKHPGLAHVPSRAADMFWHYHILDTVAYQMDCERVLGRFLHHFPYLGLRGEDDARQLEQAWDKTRALLVQEFGSAVVVTALGAQAADCDTSDCAPTPSCSGEPPEKAYALRPRPVRMATSARS